MDGMFTNATSFNQNLNEWDVSNVTRMCCMFVGALSMNQPLESWEIKCCFIGTCCMFGSPFCCPSCNYGNPYYTPGKKPSVNSIIETQVINR